LSLSALRKSEMDLFSPTTFHTARRRELQSNTLQSNIVCSLTSKTSLYSPITEQKLLFYQQQVILRPRHTTHDFPRNIGMVKHRLKTSQPLQRNRTENTHLQLLCLTHCTPLSISHGTRDGRTQLTKTVSQFVYPS